ncbi:MAG: sugar phosphate isomerase/epimerase family protein [Geminicoccaceae bacterium]
MTFAIGVISMQFVRPFTNSDLVLLPGLRELGFDFLELLVPEPEDGLDLGRLRQALAASGLDVVLAARVNARRSITSDDAGDRRGGLDYLRHCIDIASEIGADLIGGPLYGGPLVFAGRAPAPVHEDERKARFERAVEGLTKASQHASRAGVRLAIEPLNRFETDIVSTTAQGIELVDAIDSPALGLLLDSFHMNVEENSITDALRLAGSRILHFQANENHRGFPGTGHLPWTAIGSALHEVGYHGRVCLEPFRRGDERFAVPLAQWRPPAKDESAELKAAIAFIRDAFAPP